MSEHYYSASDKHLENLSGADIRTQLGRTSIANMLEISGNHEGSPLEEYLHPDDVAICKAFLEDARDHKPSYPFSTTVEFKKRRNGGLVWDRPEAFPPGGIERIVQMSKPLRIQAYDIGRVGYANTTTPSALYLCVDETLRCGRDPALFPQSYGYGVGSLPSPNLIHLQLYGVGGAESGMSQQQRSQNFANALAPRLPAR